ncbi:MAG: MarR family winged helix-turn-helix transcriptional regulator [Erysipelotrichaceae bacterium]|nr:MarR family winged helix-turn-helix transcriptional regulator [Erysipelotrichaceae bacterium]
MIPLLESIYGAKGLYQQLLGPLCRKYGLTDTEVIILLYLADKNPADTATEIIKAQRLKKAVVSVSIDDLEKRGLISSVYAKEDRRIKRLMVNEEAWTIIREARRIQDEYVALLTEGLEKDEVSELNKYLKKVNNNISRYSI